jgi:hypothetical protein
MSVVHESVEDIGKRDAETSERSLLYVALIRTCKSAAVTGYGTRTSFLS